MPKKGSFQKYCRRGHLRVPENLSGKCCLLCTRLRNKNHRSDWAKRNPEKAKAGDRRKGLRRSGWTPEAVEEARKSQNNRCAICNEPFTENNKPYADHKHGEPPKPRGLLHQKCNTALGMLKDSYELCRAAGAYLQSWELK